MTIFWTDGRGKVVRATSAVPDELPKRLRGLTPVDDEEHPSPTSGRQTWDGERWLDPDDK